MAIDTAAKRSSCLDHEEVWQFGIPLPDGTIGQGDRQHLIWTYSGILAISAVSAPGEIVFWRGSVDSTPTFSGSLDSTPRFRGNVDSTPAWRGET